MASSGRMQHHTAFSLFLISKTQSGERPGIRRIYTGHCPPPGMRIVSGHWRKHASKLVDEGTLALTTAVKLSYLMPDEQIRVDEAMVREKAVPSISRAQQMSMRNAVAAPNKQIADALTSALLTTFSQAPPPNSGYPLTVPRKETHREEFYIKSSIK